MTTGLYLYGIFPQPGPQTDDMVGLDKQPVRSHQLSDFTILYSDAQKPKYLTSRRNLLSHERVLESAMEAGHRTLLPLQFGLVIETWERVTQELITPRGNGLKQLFARLDGHREVSVKVLWQADVELNQLMAENADLRHQRDQLEGKQLSMDQVVSIGQSIEQAVNARKDDIVNAFRNTLNALAVEMVENDPMTDAMIYNAAYLIPWEAEATFSTAIETLDEQFEDRLRIRYNNFTAPFNFAQLDQLE